MSGVRLVAVDVDGTLLTDDGRVTPRTARRLAEARARGVQVVLVTGRPWAAARRPALELGLRSPVVCCHGAVVAEAGSDAVRRRLSLSPALAAEIAAALKAAGATVHAHAGADVLAPPLDEAARAFYRQHGLRVRETDDVAGLLADSGAEMLVVRDSPERAAVLARWVAERWAGRVRVHRPHARGLDVVAAGAAKEAAVAALARAWGIPREAVLAIGDAEGDAGLLAWAGLGVAVANAAPALRARAAWVVPDNNHDGVAVALERFVLRRELLDGPLGRRGPDGSPRSSS